ncbi:MAG TPA: aminotransferase class I/II-fold pyridoxal phosphate-dependent enzyme [Rhodospirillales bacterium]|nr:aminotransferase class I/II-fold pyridoxal phosphate-dependent enzyme [Rhodospirillales bacterium]
MLNPHLAALTAYPFDRLRRLLDPIEPPPDLRPLVLSVGEPRHPPPPMVAEILSREAAGWGRYPPIDGTPEFREAVEGWLARRYGLPAGLFAADRQLLPIAGSREALYLIGAVALPRRKGKGAPLVLIPNPFYQVYQGAALMHGAQAVYLDAGPATGFLPDLDAIAPEVLDRTALFFLCSPANPQGAIADPAYLRRAVTLARRHGFVLAVDECYTEIYDDAPPPGALAACAGIGDEGNGAFANVVVFHSLSKRSNVPGLRSGFVAGDPELIADFRKLRSFAGASVGLPILAASAALWRDDEHVEANRRLYRAKFDLAERLLGGRFCFYRPAGGFFLWLDVGDGEAAAAKLWREAAVRVLPGGYLAQENETGANPGRPYVRIALIDDLAATEDALRRVLKTL